MDGAEGARGRAAGDGARRAESSALSMYSELAPYWPLLSAPADYHEEAHDYVAALREHCASNPKTLLELGSGGGNNASHMKASFERVTLVDRSPEMLAVSRALNPECEHRIGDMRSVRLGRFYDCVFVHDAICYATTLADLDAVMATAHAHCAPGGAALFAPDYVRENFVAGTDHGGHDGLDGRGLRYLEWTWDPDPTDTQYMVEYALLAREPAGSVWVRHDRHLEGLFETEAWLDALRRAGFVPHARTQRLAADEVVRVIFVGVRT